MSTATRPTPPPAPPPLPEPVPLPPPTSKAAVGAGVGGAGVAIYLIDRLLADDGQVAATMLTRLSPLLGPVWASWPLIVIVLLIAWIARDRWREAQHARAVEAAALTASVAGVADGLGALRSEVHSLRADLRAHADQTDARFATTTSELQTFVRSEVGALGVRVSALESRRRGRPSA